jgi:hypothetical protein
MGLLYSSMVTFSAFLQSSTWRVMVCIMSLVGFVAGNQDVRMWSRCLDVNCLLVICDLIVVEFESVLRSAKTHGLQIGQVRDSLPVELM